MSTGREALNNLLIMRGATKQQCSAKIVDLVIAVLAEEAGLLDKVALSEIASAKAKARDAAHEAEIANGNRRSMEFKLRRIEEECDKAKREADEAKEKYEFLMRNLMQLETKEARDRARLAEMYKGFVPEYERGKGFVYQLGAIYAGAGTFDEEDE